MKKDFRVPTAVFEGMLFWTFISLISFGPILVGVFRMSLSAFIPSLLLMFFSIAAFTKPNASLARKVALSLLSIFFILTAADLIARPIMSRLRDDRPPAISPHRLTRLPQVYRYPKNVRYEDRYYGDLAIMAGKKEWREYRTLRFSTDSAGFRNEELAGHTRTVYLIMLGDSFGEGLGTSQESTWSYLLEHAYRLKTYNLSMDGAGPWQEFINLSLEIDRLKTNEKTVVLWAIFSGNDLDDDYYPYIEREQLPWLNAVGRLRFSLKSFRDNSQLRRILFQAFQPPMESQVLARDLIGERPVLFYRNYVESSNLTLDRVEGHPNYEMLKATMVAMRKLADTKGLTVMVALVPCKEEVYSWLLEGQQPWSASKEPSGFSLALKSLSEQEQFQFLDLKPFLIEASQQVFEDSGQLLYWGDDTHWNVHGHKTAAEIVYRELLEKRRFDSALP